MLAACRMPSPESGVASVGAAGKPARPGSAAAAFGDGFYTPVSKARLEVIEAPTVAQVMKAGPLGERALGRADAPVTVVEYASLTCPFCRAFHLQVLPKIKRNYIKTGKVRYILREFPIGRTSGTAWIITRCAPEKHYFRLYDLYLSRQKLWVSQQVRLNKIYDVAAKVGMTRAEFDKCLANQKIEAGLKWVKQRGRQLGVIGTPNFFINGKRVRSVLTYDQFRALVDPLLKSS